jgi:hypothetical protein
LNYCNHGWEGWWHSGYYQASLIYGKREISKLAYFEDNYRLNLLNLCIPRVRCFKAAVPYIIKATKFSPKIPKIAMTFNQSAYQPNTLFARFYIFKQVI